jgi:hypothetical protein
MNLLDGALYTISSDEKVPTYHEGPVNSFNVFTNGSSGTLERLDLGKVSIRGSLLLH